MDGEEPVAAGADISVGELDGEGVRFRVA